MLTLMIDLLAYVVISAFVVISAIAIVFLTIALAAIIIKKMITKFNNRNKNDKCKK